MAENGYVINHSSIHHGISQVRQKLEEDVDYIEVISKVANEV
jgi:hypothetical protein